MNDITTIYIEGNVGAGKSTLLQFIRKHFDVQVLNEPHELWQNVGSDNLLEKFFKDQKRWAFTLQSYITLTRVQQLQQATKENRNIVKIIERSVYSARYCFAQNAFEMG